MGALNENDGTGGGTSNETEDVTWEADGTGTVGTVGTGKTGTGKAEGVTGRTGTDDGARDETRTGTETEGVT